MIFLRAALHVFRLALLCMLLSALSPIADTAEAMSVTPLQNVETDSGFSDISVAASTYPLPEPPWTTGTLLPTSEWEPRSRRPSAFARPGPQLPAGVHAVQDGHGRIIPVRQAVENALMQRTYGPDPAAMPISPLNGTPRASQAGKSSRATTLQSRDAIPPTVQKPALPVVPVPQVSAPKAPDKPVAQTPTPPRAPAVQGPYSAPAALTGPVEPVVPEVPAVNMPSIAGQTVGQGGVMDIGTLPTTVPVGTSAIAGKTANGTDSKVSGQATSAGTNPSGTFVPGNAANATLPLTAPSNGGNHTSPENANVTSARRPILTGPAESLVIPPPGISLKPNNGTGALTTPSVSN